MKFLQDVYFFFCFLIVPAVGIIAVTKNAMFCYRMNKGIKDSAKWVIPEYKSFEFWMALALFMIPYVNLLALAFILWYNRR